MVARRDQNPDHLLRMVTIHLLGKSLDLLKRHMLCTPVWPLCNRFVLAYERTMIIKERQIRLALARSGQMHYPIVRLTLSLDFRVAGNAYTDDSAPVCVLAS